MIHVPTCANLTVCHFIQDQSDRTPSLPQRYISTLEQIFRSCPATQYEKPHHPVLIAPLFTLHVPQEPDNCHMRVDIDQHQHPQPQPPSPPPLGHDSAVIDMTSTTAETMTSTSSNSPMPMEEEPRKKGSRGGKRSVTHLSKAQLARKRANDREAQRNIRQRTKEHIENLERKVKELEAGSRSGSMERVLQRNKELEDEVEKLRAQISASHASTPPSQSIQEIPEELLIPQKVTLDWMPESAAASCTWPHVECDVPTHGGGAGGHVNSTYVPGYEYHHGVRRRSIADIIHAQCDSYMGGSNCFWPARNEPESYETGSPMGSISPSFQPALSVFRPPTVWFQ